VAASARAHTGVAVDAGTGGTDCKLRHEVQGIADTYFFQPPQDDYYYGINAERARGSHNSAPGRSPAMIAHDGSRGMLVKHGVTTPVPDLRPTPWLDGSARPALRDQGRRAAGAPV
jgi:hypothetical protein